MAVSHAKSITIGDFTGTVTAFNSQASTTTVAATDLARPADWNSAHNQYFTLSGNTNNASTASGTNVVLSGGNNVTLIGSNSVIGFSVGNYITTGAASDHSHGNPQLNLTNLSGTTASASNGFTLSLSAAAGGGGGTATMWQPFNEGVNVAGQRGQASWALAPLPTPPTAAGGIVSIDRVCFPILVSNSSNSTGSATVSMSFGMYTKNAGSLSLAHSTTGTLAVTYSGTVNNSTVAGIRLMTVPWTTTFGDDRYYVAVASSTATANTNCTISQMLVSQVNSNFSGLFGANSNRSHQWPVGWGVYSAASGAFPNPIPISQIDGTASLAARPPSWFMINGTV